MTGFQDFNGQPIARDSRVTVDGAFATVIRLSAPDGIDHDGLVEWFQPSMTVRFDTDGLEERLLCETLDDGSIECDDAHVLVSSPLFEMMHGLARREWGTTEAGLA